MITTKNNILLQDVLDTYNELIKSALKLNYLVRDSALQAKMCDELTRFVLQLKNIKTQAIEQDLEDVANLMFHCQCVLNALISILSMWMELKLENLCDAWDLLIDAEEYLSWAKRVPLSLDITYGMDELGETLTRIGTVIFPKWPYYLSPAFIKTEGNCSICGKRYSECEEHIEGLVYFGRACRHVNKKIIDSDHISLVERPKDKRCIIKFISTEDGRKRDYMTWRVTEAEDKFLQEAENVACAGMLDGVFYTMKQLDLD